MSPLGDACQNSTTPTISCRQCSVLAAALHTGKYKGLAVGISDSPGRHCAFSHWPTVVQKPQYLALLQILLPKILVTFMKHLLFQRIVLYILLCIGILKHTPPSHDFFVHPSHVRIFPKMLLFTVQRHRQLLPQGTFLWDKQPSIQHTMLVNKIVAAGPIIAT